jgi:hypothetical protein
VLYVDDQLTHALHKERRGPRLVHISILAC